MDYITSKVFVIAVGIFVTLAIFTGVIFVFSNVYDIFDMVENTDTSIYGQYDNIYSTYSGSVLNTVGLLNTLRKYEEQQDVRVLVAFVPGEEASEGIGKEGLIKDTIPEYLELGKIGYETLYDVSVNEDNDGYIYITFTRK